MLLLTTTLLTVQTSDKINESYQTIDGRADGHRTVDKQSILTSDNLTLANREESYINKDVVNSLTYKENESASQLLNKQRNGQGNGNNFATNDSFANQAENNYEKTPLQTGATLSFLHKNEKSSSIKSTKSDEIDTVRKSKYNVNEHNSMSRTGKLRDSKKQRLVIIDKKSKNTERNNKSHNHSKQNVDEPNDAKQNGRILNIEKPLGRFEEIHVFEEDEEDEIIIEVIDEDANDDASVTHIHLEETTLDNAVEFGMKSMEDLVKVKEPLWYQMGLILDRNDPASKVAAFGKPNEMALKLSQFGFLALEASKKIAESFPENVSRQASGFPGSFHPRLLQDDCPLKGLPRCHPASKRYRTADGTCNNIEQPWRGSAMLPMQRFLPPAYEDGIQSVRRSIFGSRLPSARDISVRIHRDRNHEIPTVTLMFMQWGQFIDHDVTSVVKSRSFNGSIPRCCDRGGREMLPPELTHPSCLPIEVSPDDWFMGQFGIKCMEFIRSAPSTRINCDLGWREQINQVTPYIDASTIYGSDIETSDSVRTFRNGKILYGRPQNQGPLQPPDPPGGELCRSGALTDDCFQSGDGRVSEQPGLTAIHTVWVRLHNKVATVLSKFNPHWSDEKIFQETRKISYSLIQHITYREFLPIVLGPEVMQLFELNLVRKGYYDKYDSKVNPAIANSFSAAAYRFGHSMVQNSYVRTDHKHRPLFNNVTLHEELENVENIWSFGSVDRLLLGFANQPSQRRDEFICDELSNHLFQPFNARFGMDLAAINIQRGRDHGIPPYTSWRQPCGLSPVKDWQDLESIFNFDSVRRFQTIYRHVDDIDLFSGGLAERPVRGGVVGPTFACIIAQQFLNLRKGDRFWYENGGFESSFTPAQLQQIRHVTFAQILCQTMTEIESLQPFVFLSPDNQKNARLPCNGPLIDNFDLTAWVERERNEVDNRIDFDFKRESVDEFPETESEINKRRVKRSRTRTTTVRPKATTKRKPNRKKNTTEAPLRIKVTNVTTNTVKLQKGYGGGSSGVAVNSIPPKPTYSNFRPQIYYSNNDQTDVTYVFGVMPTKTTYQPPKGTDKPVEVNIKIQYYLQTTEKPTSTRKKKKKTTSKPANSYGQDSAVVITQRPPSKKPVAYPVFLQSQGYDNVVVRPNDLFEKPTSKPRPTYSYTDNKRPTQIYNRPTAQDTYGDNGNSYNRPSSNGFTDVYSRPISYNTDFYSYSDRSTTKRPYTVIRPQTFYDSVTQNPYDDTVFENQPFSTSKRPYIYRPESNHYVYTDVYTTRRPSYKPQQSSYDDELVDDFNNYNKRPTFKPQQSGYDDELVNDFNNYNKRPTVQNSYNRDDPINEVYAHLLNEQDRVDYIPKKPSFGGVDTGEPTPKPTTGYISDKIGKPNRIYSIGHVHKLDNDKVSDKLDFKSKFITKRKGANSDNDDRRFVKISSVKAGAIVNDESGVFYSVQRRDGDDDLGEDEESDNVDGDKIQVVQIDVSPSEVKDEHWLVYNATEEIMPLLPVPDINANVSCSSELPKPMKNSKIVQNSAKEGSRNL